MTHLAKGANFKQPSGNLSSDAPQCGPITVVAQAKPTVRRQGTVCPLFDSHVASGVSSRLCCDAAMPLQVISENG
ncbi:hypothetical protein CEXT_47201 [Caerostris extrusa]|uniref:Uncharacterized protein n=1 Tax=Caerostris extrusa TaxID=172846 RepID=A0AAV4Y6I9_CAEEX|nr:hypothetical protein CEXT_47201 [Caerostris extrusa]